MNILENFMLRILIADDHDIVRQGIKQLLADEFEPVHVGEAIDTTTLVELAMSDSWDIIISDLVMPGGGGFYALEKIKQGKPNQPVIILSTHPAEQYAHRAIKAGAEEFVNKSTLPTGLVEAVQHVLDKKKD